MHGLHSETEPDNAGGNENCAVQYMRIPVSSQTWGDIDCDSKLGCRLCQYGKSRQ